MSCCTFANALINLSNVFIFFSLSYNLFFVYDECYLMHNSKAKKFPAWTITNSEKKIMQPQKFNYELFNLFVQNFVINKKMHQTALICVCNFVVKLKVYEKRLIMHHVCEWLCRKEHCQSFIFTMILRCGSKSKEILFNFFYIFSITIDLFKIQIIFIPKEMHI